MRESFKTGISFGLTSAVITTLGMIMGLYKTTSSAAIVIAGILTIAIADSFSDALGIHISKEASRRNGQKAIWEATITTFITKFFIALLFVIPFAFLTLKTAISTSIILGILLIAGFSFKVARSRGENPYRAIGEHLTIGAVVLVLTWFVGKLINVYLVG
jgi:vacuolar iron transporter family protein